jgi:uncharacterized phage protein (TIGR01671 family)
MREIKFRGKRVDNGEWVYGAFVPDALETPDNDLITWGFIRRYNRDIGKMETIEVARESVGQYTGIKDKKGVEIYEGDIVTGRDALSEGFSFTGFVDHENGSFVIKSAIVTHYRWLDYILETIGNIHDNPELLEVG